MATLPFLVASAFVAVAPKVTFHERAQPLSLLLPKLSPLVERPLAVHPALAREWLVVDVKDADPQELLARVAEVTHAEWIQEGGEWRLKRSAETERRLAAEERAAHAASLRSQWAEALKQPFDVASLARRRRDAKLQHDYQGDGDAEPTDYPGLGVVLERYLNEILLQIPIEAIVNVPDRRGFVMSDVPKGSQRPLPASALPVVRRLLRDYEAFAAVLRPVEPDEYPDRAAARVKVSVTAYRQTPGRLRIFAGIQLLDDRDRVVFDTGIPFYAPPVPPAAPSLPSKPFIPSPTSDALERVLQSEVPLPTAPPAIQNLVLQPEREGRLSRLWSDVMFELAARESRSLVANLPDVVEDYTFPRKDGPVSLERYIDRLDILEFRREGGWLTTRPRHPGPAGRFRADREAVGWAVRTIAEDRPISIEAAAKLMNRIGATRWPLETRLRAADATGGASANLLLEDEPGHEIIRLLPPSMLAALYEGRPLAFGILPAPLQTYLREVYLQMGAGMCPLLPESSPDFDGNEADLTDLVGPAQVARLVIQGRVTTETAFISRVSGSPHVRRIETPGSLANRLDDDFQPHPRRPEDGEGAPPIFNEFRVARRRLVTITVHFPAGRGYTTVVGLEDYGFNPRDPFLPAARLPKSILDEVRKEKQDSRGGDGEGGR